MTADARPIPLQERIPVLDVIRGFALLGIFIMNMPGFNTSFFAEADGSHLWPGWWDRSAEVVRDVLFSGKFNSMFSLLFAIGFTIQLGRLRERSPQRATAIYLRRLACLLGFGALHACVWWTGDVLHIYAVLGLVLMLISRWPDRALYVLIGACLLYTPIAGIVRWLLWTPEASARLVSLQQAWEASNNAAYGHGTFLEAAREHSREMLALYTNPTFLSWMASFYVQMLTTVTIGLLLGRHRVFQNAAALMPQIRRAQWTALGLGILCGIGFGVWEATVKNPTLPGFMKTLAGVCYALCRVSIMIFYVATITRALQVGRWRQRLSFMAIPGRMPLTNYLLETMLGTALFYGWGAGLWGKIGPALSLVLPFVLFFGLLVPLSRWWLAHFERGPMEQLWRVLTYGRGALRSHARDGASPAEPA